MAAAAAAEERVAGGLALIPLGNLAARCNAALRFDLYECLLFLCSFRRYGRSRRRRRRRGGIGGGLGMSGAGTAGFRPLGEREPTRSFLRVGRAVSPASCAATELELDPPIAIAPAAGGGGGGGLLLDLAGISTVVPPRF